MSLLNNIFGSGAQNSILGTSEDEMYRNHMDHLRAHEEELMRQKYAAQANVYSQQLANSMAQTKQAALMGAYAKQAAIKPFNPNELEAYKIPLSNLVTLWQAKYGDEWVDKFDDSFWNDACDRLDRNGKLENAKGAWFRIKEDV
jgi:hypothetical protein